jgi:hypothetical protein
MERDMSRDEVTDTESVVDAIAGLTNAVKESTAAADRRHAESMELQKQILGALQRGPRG